MVPENFSFLKVIDKFDEMLKVKIEDLKNDLSLLLEAIQERQEIHLTKSGHLIAVVQPVANADKTKRNFGTEKGKIILHLTPSKKPASKKAKEETS